MKVSFTEKGSGSAVVLIHGFCETNEIWSEFADQLSRKYRVLMPDLPGFGKSPLPENNFSIADIADLLYDWLRSLGLKKVVMIGHSLGGYVTLALANKFPETLSGFGLFHSTAFADGEEKKISRNKTIDFINERGVEVFAQSFVPQLFYAKNRKFLKNEVEKVVRIAASSSQATLIEYTRAMRDRHDRTEVLKAYDGPILIIAGDKDTAVPVETISEQELMPKKAVVHVYDNTGHMGMFEKKEQTLRAVEDFIDYCL